MFLSYLKTAIRNLRRQPGYSFINIAGLSIGMACFIFIALIIRGELRVDKFHERADRIYRVIRVDHLGETTRMAITQAPLAAALKRDYPEVERAACFNYIGGEAVRYGDKTIQQDWISLAEPDFFEIFSYTFLAGNPESALKSPHSAVLTEAVSRKFFGRENPLGKTLHVRGMPDVTVTAVLKDHKDSHLHFSIILPFSLYREIGVDIEDWGRYNYTTYVQLRENADPAAFGAKIEGAIRRYASSGTKIGLELQPLKRIYLHSDYAYDLKALHLSVLIIYFLGLVAFLILLIASINFVNLATARSARRAREVGLRKVVGATRGQLMAQFLGESLVTSFLSLVLATAIVESLLPFVNRLQPYKSYALFGASDGALYLGLVLVALLTGLMAGSYPAVFLSRFQPANVFRAFSSPGSSRGILRKALVIGQFAFSILLIIATLAVFRQMRYMQSKDLGYDKANLLVCDLPDSMRAGYERLKADLLRHPQISHVTACLNLPTWEGPSYLLSEWDGRSGDKTVSMSNGSVDYDFFETFGIKIVQGRPFSRDFPTDKEAALILNEEAVRVLGMKDPVGKTMRHFKGKGTIIGVMEDYHYATLRDKIGPLVLNLDPQNTSHVVMKVRADDLAAVKALVEETWNRYDPSRAFQARLLDEILDDVYLTENIISRFFNYAAYLSILISCLGLFGLAAYSVEQRKKEVGIRKVMGASVRDIVRLLSKDYLKLVATAVLVAWPLGYLAMKTFLRSYPFRTSLGIEIFLISAAAALGIAFLTVFYQTYRAARAVPAETLKYE